MRFKLVSPKDTLLGHVDVPDSWHGLLDEHGHASIPKVMSRGQIPVEELMPVVDFVWVTLVRAGWSQFDDAVCLAEGTIEQLETMRDVSFAPSAAYLRSLVE